MAANNKNKKTMYLIDISSLFFRSYYAISANMKNKKNQPTNALYGVFRMFNKLIKDKSPDHIISCFDTKHPSFRKDLYSEYKANRDEMPEDLQEQVPYLKQMMEVLQIPAVEKKGFEADDIIGSLALAAKKENLETYIVSGDKDFAQLVDNEVFLYDTMKEIIYNPAAVKQKWGVYPEQMLDYLSLVGDSSDNVPGVRGIGPKGATTLLEKYQNLDNIYKNLDIVTGSTQKKLQEGKEMAYLSKKLIDLKTDMGLVLDIEKSKLQRPKDFADKDREKLKSFLEELNFKSFLDMFFAQPKPKTTAQVTPAITSVKKSKADQSKDLILKPEDFLNQLEAYETIWLGFKDDSLYMASKKNITILQSSDYKKTSQVLDEKWIRYAGYNLKYSWKKLGCKNPVAEWDTMIASHLLDSQASKPFKVLCSTYIGKSIQEEDSIRDIYKTHLLLKRDMENRLKDLELTKVYKEIELPLISVLYFIEQKGLLLDMKEVKSQSDRLSKDIEKLEKKICELAQEEFNVSSPKQLAVILFDKLKLPKGRKTKLGYSTDSHELIKMKDLHPILPFLIEHRELFKLKTTYTDSLLSLVDSKTQRVHTQFRQASTSTGRLSSVNPNLQNIPIRTKRGREIRKCFIAPKGFQLISADYSQIELRILAHITEDPGLVTAFENDLDIHASTASEIFNKPLKEITSDLRRVAKAVNFGIAYGQGVYGLSSGLGISREEAKNIIANYFKKYKKIKDYIENIKQEAAANFYVKTIFGRKRFFHETDFKNPRMRAAIERAAINAPLQGSASDLVKMSMIKLDASLPISILSQVHDELLFECPNESVDFESKEITNIMENCVKLKIPLKINIATGTTWEQSHS